MKIKIETAENGFIVEQAGEMKRVYKSKDELLKCEFAYIFDALKEEENNGKVGVNIVLIEE